VNLFADGLLVPALVLAFFGWMVPRLLSAVFPEGVKPLLILAFVAALIMMLLGAVFFMVLYAAQGAPIADIFEPGLGAGILHFSRLAMISALLWGPILVLSVAGLPKRWVEETW